MKFLLDGEQTFRLNFRKAELTDYDSWLPFFTDPRTHLYWNDKPINPHEECKKWYDKQQWRYENDMGGMNALIEKESGRFIGHCGLVVQTVDEITELEVGYSLLPEFWNKGYATEAARKCRDFAFENNLAESVISIISIKNLPSQKVAGRNGMKIEKQTIYRENDVYIYRITRDEYLKLLRMDA